MKKTLAIMLALIMVLALVPSVAFAEEPVAVAWIGETGYETLEAAVTAATDGAVIMLGEGDFSTYGNTPPKKSLTFVGAESGKTNWYIGSPTPDKQKEGTEYNGDYSFQGCESITFKNIKFSVYPSNYKGFIRINNVEVDGCEITGMSTYWGYSKTTFKNTTFNCPAGEYALWYYTGTEMSFDHCTFNASGKVVHAYREGTTSTADKPLVLNFKDCKVFSSKANKSVLNIKDANNYYTVNISGTNTVEGLNPNNQTCSRLFQVECYADNYNLSGGKGNSNKCQATVKIDGKTVWENGKMVSHAIGTQYTDGYKDNAFTVTPKPNVPGSFEVKCIHCGYTEISTGELSNEIELERTVKQNSKSVSEDTPNSNKYKVANSSDITVDYTATMNMENLRWQVAGKDVKKILEELKVPASSPWELLMDLASAEQIDDRTEVILTFKFGDNIDLKAFKDTYEAAVKAGTSKDVLKLTSDMFEMTDVAFGPDNTMTIKCNWNWNKGKDPDPKITLYGCGLPVNDKWGGNNQIVITNSGCVGGTVHIKYKKPESYAKAISVDPAAANVQEQNTYPPVDNTIKIPIVGGCKTDEFTLYYGGGSSGDSGHSYYHPTTTPVPVIVIPPKTGDMTVWQSILHFLGIR